MSFDKIFDLTAGVYFFFNKITSNNHELFLTADSKMYVQNGFYHFEILKCCALEKKKRSQQEICTTGLDLAHRRLTPDFTFFYMLNFLVEA